MKKRILSVLITVVMLIGMLPTAVFAEGTTPYDLWVGGVQVTSANKDDITTAITEAGGTADGTATYDPESETLTLNGFSYTGQGYVYDSPWCAAIFAKNDLTVKVVGSNTVTASVTDPYTAEALNVWGALTITGDSGSSLTLTGAEREGVGCGGNLKIENVTVNATGTNGLYSYEGITINNAIVTAVGTDYDAISSEKAISITNSSVEATSTYIYGSGICIGDTGDLNIVNSTLTASGELHGIRVSSGSVNVTNSLIEITAQDGFAIKDTFIDVAVSPCFIGGGTNYTVIAGDNSASAAAADATLAATYENKYVKIEPVKYDLWVGGVQVTSANKDNIVVPGATGSATYDPDTKTLTLNNFSYTGEGRETEYYNAAISTDSINLNVKLVGTNTIICQSDDESVKCRAICVWYGLDTSAGNLTIYGTDKETDKLICTANDGILSVRSITVEDATVQTNGALISSAVSDVTITDSIVSADLEAGDITLENSELEISETAYVGDNFTITNSTVTGGGLSAFDDASTLTVTGSQVNVTVISAYGFIIKGNSNVTAQAIFVDRALIVTDSSVHVTGCELPELGLEGSFGILLLRSDGVVAIDNSTVEVYGGNGAYLYTDDFLTFTPFAPSFVDGEEAADPYDYTVYAGESAPGQCADASDVNTYANKYVKIGPVVMITKIEKTSTEGLVDTYTITYTDGTTTTFTVTNGEKGDKGDQGIQGIQGVPGADGHTPVITIQNGFWHIDGVNTNQAAQGVKGDKGDKGDTGATGATGAQGPQGEKGDKGDTGATGNGIASITTSKENGITTVTIKFTDPNMADVVFTIEDGTDGAKGDKGDTGVTGAPGAQGPQGEKGDKGDTGAQGEKGDKGNTGAAGADGVGIANIEKSSSDGNVDTYTITLTNGTTYTFTVTNGTNGTDGKDGVDGKDGTNGTNGVDGKDGTDGEDGQTPYIGENGNWWIGDTDTGVKAAGDDGKDGAIIVATAVGGTALISNIVLIAWTLIKKKRLF